MNEISIANGAILHFAKVPAELVKKLQIMPGCPVINAPHHADPIENILFAYGGVAHDLRD